MTKVYCRCNSGHYFIGAICPLDGWSSAESVELTKTVEVVMNAGKELSMTALCQAGLSALARKRTIIIEFGNDESGFDAVSPAGYFVNGQWIKQRDFDEDFL